jgi:palmitoyltransferase
LLRLLQTAWDFYTPEAVFLGIYILAGVIGLAVFAMGSYHLWGVASSETAVEGQDHDQYRKIARGRGEVSLLLVAMNLD